MVSAPKLACAEGDRCGRAVVAVDGADAHVGTVGGEYDLGERAGKAGARLDERDQRARGEVDALEHAAPFEPDFPRQPMRGIGIEEGVVVEHRMCIAFRLEHDGGDVELVEADVEDGIVELAGELQRPERRALRDHFIRRRGRRVRRPAQHDGSEARFAIERHGDIAIVAAVVADAARERRQRNAAHGTIRTHPFPRLGGDRGLELAVGHHGVDQPPLHRALALHALFRGAEDIRMVAADLSLVGDARQAAGAGQHREQRHLRQRHRGGTVVHQHDIIGGERHLVAAARRGAVDHGDGAQARGCARILDGVARLVGELAEVDLVGMAGAGQHADIGAGTEHPRLGRAQLHHPHRRMLEPNALERIGQLDVDAEVIGIELELVAFEQPALLVHVHGERRDGAVDGERPMAIARRLGRKIDPAQSIRELVRGFRHYHPRLLRHKCGPAIPLSRLRGRAGEGAR